MYWRDRTTTIPQLNNHANFQTYPIILDSIILIKLG